MNNVLYSVFSLKIKPGGPRTRILSFIEVFYKKNQVVIYDNLKIRSPLYIKKINILYIESSTHRISLIDFFSLLLLKLKAKKTIVFIRDIYIEYFPEEYQSFRGQITVFFNKISYLFLALIANQMAFPTLKMGEVFFKKNTLFPKRPYFDLPPGTQLLEENRKSPDFRSKIGILYMGSTEYKNSGFENFLTFSRKYYNKYNFYVLTKSPIPKTEKQLNIHFCKQEEIAGYVAQNNIAYGYHSRKRNDYDDLTFPIKVLDFISLGIPFFSENHLPLQILLGSNYPLFVQIDDFNTIDRIISLNSLNQYHEWVSFLKTVAKNNTYEQRYQKILSV